MLNVLRELALKRGKNIDTFERGKFYLEKAMSLGSSRASHILGVAQLDRLEQKEAVETFSRGLELEDAGAIGELIKCYEKGVGVKPDNGKVFELSKKLSDLDDEKRETYYLARCYEFGIGVKKDYKEALRLYLRSKKPEAKNRVGYFYEIGRVVERDYNKAAQSYKSYPTAFSLYRLGRMRELGKGVLQDKVVAASYYKRACEEHSQIACDAERRLFP